MNTTIDVYLGAPIAHESEKLFLAKLCSDLKSRGQSAVIIGKFMLSNRQIDFLVVDKREVRLPRRTAMPHEANEGPCKWAMVTH